MYACRRNKGLGFSDMQYDPFYTWHKIFQFNSGMDAITREIARCLAHSNVIRVGIRAMYTIVFTTAWPDASRTKPRILLNFDIVSRDTYPVRKPFNIFCDSTKCVFAWKLDFDCTNPFTRGLFHALQLSSAQQGQKEDGPGS